MNTESPTPLWERQPWDTDKSFAAFRAYLDMDRNRRSLGAVYRAELVKIGKKTARDNGDPVQAPGYWWNWFHGRDPKGNRPAGSVYENSRTWAERVQAWEAEQDRLHDEEWAKRRQQIRDKEWELSQKLIERATHMLAAPVFRREITSANGQAVTILEPTEWAEGDIARALDLAFKLGRRSSELETARIQIDNDWQKQLAAAGIDPATAYQQLVDALAAAKLGGVGGDVSTSLS
jgi:hypothetical protein